MSPPCNTRAPTLAAGRVYQLKCEPEADKEKGRDFHEPGKNENWNQGQDPGSGVQDEIGAHDTGNSTAGTDGGNGRIHVQKQMRQARSETAQEVEQEIPKRSQAVFDIVAKDVERPHISQEMQKTSVKKHEGYEGKHLLEGCEIGTDVRDGVAGRYQSIGIDKTIHFIPQRHLEQKHNHIDTDKSRVYHREISGRIDVSNGDHFF